MIPVIDAHHHIWRQIDLPWLLGPTQPRIFGPYDAIKRDYGIEEYLADIAGTGVVKSVYVQANWAPNWFADEAAWVQETADRTGWPHAIVGFCDMTQKDARRDLDRLAKYPLVRGVRQQFHWHENPLYRFAKRHDLAADPLVRKNVAHLAQHGWSFDLQIFAHQVEPACALVDACPDVTFVLQHAGMLEDLSEEGRDAWRQELKTLARRKNVVSKLSAFGTFIHRNDPAHIAWMVAETVAIFGPKRCLYGSNFPIEKLWTDYASLIGAFRAAAAPLSAAAQKAIFHDTARRVYRL
ncbi:MAG: amidohydrolase family protein [Rhizobiaceae bacterium]|nr:MAG: amidohydrolase family protein [Rhizobiaceae bacterium]CAG1007608.1 L-fuconolactonase [Rhizobiaceae bacterium]